VLGTYSAASRWSKTPPLERVYFTMYKKNHIAVRNVQYDGYITQTQPRGNIVMHVINRQKY